MYEFNDGNLRGDRTGLTSEQWDDLIENALRPVLGTAYHHFPGRYSHRVAIQRVRLAFGVTGVYAIFQECMYTLEPEPRAKIVLLTINKHYGSEYSEMTQLIVDQIAFGLGGRERASKQLKEGLISGDEYEATADAWAWEQFEIWWAEKVAVLDSLSNTLP